MLTCKDASHLISEGQDRNLNLRERVALRLHLWMCDSCRLFEKQMGYLRQALHQGWTHGDLPLDKQLPTDAQERIRQAIKKRIDDNGS